MANFPEKKEPEIVLRKPLSCKLGFHDWYVDDYCYDNRRHENRVCLVCGKKELNMDEHKKEKKEKERLENKKAGERWDRGKALMNREEK